MKVCWIGECEVKVDTKRIQKRLLEMAIAVKEIFERENIKYMIAYGTLLGAVRHGGFIPWDDDFDFFLFQEDYEKAVQALRRDLPEDLFLEDIESEPLYFHSWPHVKDLKSVTVFETYPQDNIYSHKGLSIDLYVAVKMDERDMALWRLKQNLAYRERLYARGIIDAKQFEQYNIQITAKIAEEEQSILQKAPLGEQYATLFDDRILYCDDLFPLKEYTFEGVPFLGPRNVDKVLTGFFGEYMELPPLEKRCSHFTSVVFLDGR